MMELPKPSSYKSIQKNLFSIRRESLISDIICLPLWSMDILKGIGSKEATSEHLQPSILLITVKLESTSQTMLSKNGFPTTVDSRKETSSPTRTTKLTQTNNSEKDTIFSNKSTPK